MGFLALIADGVRFLVTLPYTILGSMTQLKIFRYVTTRSVTSVRGELEPLSGVARFFRGLGLLIIGLLAVAVVGGVLYGLWYLNNRLDLERQLAGPWPLLRKVWLPLLFLLFCGLFAAAWWLWKLLGPDREPNDFPDIVEAWAEARAALQAAGVRLTEVPLFLVLGRPAAGVPTLFGASRLPWPVRQVPRRGDAPIQVYANGLAVYVACPGVSLLARLAALLAGEGGDAADAALPKDARTVFVEEAPEPAEGAEGAQPEPAEPLLLAEPAPAATLLAEAPVATAAPPRPRPRLVKMTQEVAKLQARLDHLGRLIAFHRRPYCGVNGILLLLPFASADDDEGASQTATLALMDLKAARAALKTECPVFAVVCDLETAPGANEFLKHFPEERRLRLLGQAFPLRPDVEPKEVPAVVEDGVLWVGEALGRLVTRLYRPDEPGREGTGESLPANAALYRLYAAVRERLGRFGRILGRAATPEGERRPMLGGCFLAATGPDPARDQAFAAGVFRLLLDHQNAVTWTPEALAEEADHRRWAILGYAGIGAFALGLILLGYWQLRG